MTAELAAFSLGFLCGGAVSVFATALAVFAYKAR